MFWVIASFSRYSACLAFRPTFVDWRILFSAPYVEVNVNLKSKKNPATVYEFTRRTEHRRVHKDSPPCSPEMDGSMQDVRTNK